MKKKQLHTILNMNSLKKVKSDKELYELLGLEAYNKKNKKQLKARLIGFTNKKNVLLIKRTKPDKPSYFTFIGGTVEHGELIKEALIREAFEESNAVLSKIEPVLVRETDSTIEVFYKAKIADWSEENRTGKEIYRQKNGLYELIEMPVKALNALIINPKIVADHVHCMSVNKKNKPSK